MTPSDIEKSRKEFIAAASHRGFDFSYTLLSGGQIMFNDDKIDLLWEGFLLRQKSLVVELPERNNSTYALELRAGFNACLDKVKQSLQSAGINYTEKE